MCARRVRLGRHLPLLVVVYVHRVVRGFIQVLVQVLALLVQLVCFRYLDRHARRVQQAGTVVALARLSVPLALMRARCLGSEIPSADLCVSFVSGTGYIHSDRYKDR